MGHGTETERAYNDEDEIQDEWERPRFSAPARDRLALELAAHRLADACWADGVAAYVAGVSEHSATVRVGLVTVYVAAHSVLITRDGALVRRVVRGRVTVRQLVAAIESAAVVATEKAA